MFLALHLQLCIFDLADRCEATCVARQSPGGHTCAEGGGTAPSSSSIWHQLPITQNLSAPSTFPQPPRPHSSLQALAGIGWTHPLLLRPLFPLDGLPRQMGMVCQSEGPPLLLWDGTTPAFHQAFQYRNHTTCWLHPKPWLPGPYRATSGSMVGSTWLSHAGNPLSALSPRLLFAILVKIPGLSHNPPGLPRERYR